MKYALYLIILLGFLACQDDDNISFDVSFSKENFRFEPVPGGAVMYYKLPAEASVFGVRVRYEDAQGEQVMKVGSYVGDSVIIDGFNEACKNVPAKVVLVDHHNNESEAVDVTFDTEESSTYSFFRGVEVLPSWDGFQVRYGASRQVSGMAHVMYLGTNPLTQQPDTLLLESFPITLYGDTLYFALKQKQEKVTVVIRTEDYRGYRVKQEIWEDIEVNPVEKLEFEEADFIDKDNCSWNNKKEKIGVEYLFDGDTKGMQRFLDGDVTHLYSFMAGPCISPKSFILDMKQGRVPARVRIYGALRSIVTWPTVSTKYESSVANIIHAAYDCMLPCSVTIYGGNDKDGDDWTEIGSYAEDWEVDVRQRWSWPCSIWYTSTYATEKGLEEADPCYIEITFPCEGEMEKYRYIKLAVNEVFKYGFLYGGNTWMMTDSYNKQRYVMMQELEVYVKKD